MIAVLKEIVETVILRPTYDNTRVANFVLWANDNEDDLKGYYLALGKTLPDPDSTDNLLETSRAQKFLTFQKCQWDRARGAF